MSFFSALEVKYWTDGMAHRVKSLLPKKDDWVLSQWRKEETSSVSGPHIGTEAHGQTLHYTQKNK